MLLFLTGCGEPGQNRPVKPDPHKNLSVEFPGLEEISEGLSLRALELNTGVRYTLPAYQNWYEDFPAFPERSRELCRKFIKDARKPGALLYHAFRLLGAPAGGFGPPLSGVSQDRQAVPVLFPAEAKQQWELLPEALQAGIRDFLMDWKQGAGVMKEFTGPVLGALQKEGCIAGDASMAFLMEPWREKQLYSFRSVELIERADLRKLSFASTLIMAGMQKLTQLYPLQVEEAFKSCVLETELGKIGIFGTGRDTITSGFSLVIDLGGDDLYTGNIASTSPEKLISLVLDFAGNDNYKADDGALALACAGIGFLFDLEGDDLYHCRKTGLASAIYGTSLVYDLEGDDRYWSGSGYSQAAAHLGTALLVDLEGDDSYSSAGNSQAFGGTLGIGVLLDLTGDDRYNNAQSGPSFVQGAGRGRWAEASDGHSLGGGLGIFVDGGGADHCYAGSFSQGASYFTGTGLFFDLEGDDDYNALSHSQGYAAHYALAGFFEMGGNDRYNADSDPGRITQLLGNGRDLSAACFIEECGDDTYHLGNRSAGIGDLKGIGIMWDRRGENLFTWHQNSVNAGSPSMGHSFGLTEGMSIGTESPAFPEGYPSGWLRDDGKSRLQIIDRY